MVENQKNHFLNIPFSPFEEEEEEELSTILPDYLLENNEVSQTKQELFIQKDLPPPFFVNYSIYPLYFFPFHFPVFYIFMHYSIQAKPDTISYSQLVAPIFNSFLMNIFKHYNSVSPEGLPVPVTFTLYIKDPHIDTPIPVDLKSVCSLTKEIKREKKDIYLSIKGDPVFTYPLFISIFPKKIFE